MAHQVASEGHGDGGGANDGSNDVQAQTSASERGWWSEKRRLNLTTHSSSRHVNIAHAMPAIESVLAVMIDESYISAAGFDHRMKSAWIARPPGSSRNHCFASHSPVAMSRACQSLASSVIRVCARHPAAASARRVSVLASQVAWAPHVPASSCFQRRMASSKVEEVRSSGNRSAHTTLHRYHCNTAWL